jgi:hypothetical protein
VLKLLVGILKGVIVGGAVGYGAYALGDATGFGNPWLTYGVIGAFVGLIVGRPIWSLLRDQNATAWIAILKAAFGFGVGCGLYAIVAKVWSPSALTVMIGAIEVNVFDWPVTVGAAIGAVYGGFVELDDAIGDDKKPPPSREPAQPAKQLAAKRPPGKA